MAGEREALSKRLLLSMIAVLTLAVAGCGEDRGAQEAAAGTTGGTTGEETTQEATGGTSVGSTPALEEASATYQEYVTAETDDLVDATERFTGAVISGDVERAKRLYAPTRVHWERIEPIAATLGDLDPQIDAREGDVPEEEWGGFHRIEQALWEENTTEGQEEYARGLMEDVEALRTEVDGLQLEPSDPVVGSIELLNEVSAGKITGEEERYSHTDLYSIAANIEGSEAAFRSLEPALEEEDPELVAEINGRFTGLYDTLEPYREGDGWVPYTDLDEGERRELSQSVDALAEPLSRVGQVLQA